MSYPLKGCVLVSGDLHGKTRDAKAEPGLAQMSAARLPASSQKTAKASPDLMEAPSHQRASWLSGTYNPLLKLLV